MLDYSWFLDYFDDKSRRMVTISNLDACQNFLIKLPFMYGFRLSSPPISLAASAFLGLALPGEKGSWETESKVCENWKWVVGSNLGSAYNRGLSQDMVLSLSQLMSSRVISFGHKQMMMEILRYLMFNLETMNFMVGCLECLVITNGKASLQFNQVGFNHFYGMWLCWSKTL